MVKYDNHPDLWKKIIADPGECRKSMRWLLADRLDWWRHIRMCSPLEGLIKTSTDKSWLTIGDGRYGTDAQHLMLLGAKSVHATDISDELLKIGFEKNLLSAFSAQNAEALSFADNAFDFVYCKAAYHHFPRPYLAMYEMLRVCRDAVILIEPDDPFVSLSFKSLLKRLLRRPMHDFEDIGNYAYSISPREIEKLMLGLGLRWYATKPLNDYYIAGVEDIPLSGGTLGERLVRLRLKAAIAVKNILSNLGGLPNNLLLAIIFKTEPSPGMVAPLKSAGFKFHVLPKNPYA